MNRASKSFWGVVCGILLIAGVLVWRVSNESNQITNTRWRSGASLRSDGLRRSDSPRRLQRPPALLTNWRIANAREKTLARQLVVAQLNAFRVDNYAAAQRMLTPRLARAMGSADAFRSRTKNAYPQFARYQSVQFQKIEADLSGQQLRLECTINGRGSGDVSAIYNLHKNSGNNSYLIDGISPQRITAHEYDEAFPFAALPENR